MNYTNYQKIGVECELAVRLSKDIYNSEEPNIESLYDSIEEIIAAIELIWS